MFIQSFYPIPLQNRNPAIQALDAKGKPGRFDLLLQGEDRCHQQFGASAEMMKSFDPSGEETVHTGPNGALPILIFPHDLAKAVLDGYPVDVEKVANRMQDDLKKLSTRSRRIIDRNFRVQPT